MTKVSGHYDGLVYLELRFESKGKLVAAALVKVAFLKNKSKVPIEDMLKSIGVDHLGDSEPYLEKLYQSEKEFLSFIKKDYSSSEPSSKISQV